MDQPKDRIIVALDVNSAIQALRLVEGLSPCVGAFKIGLEFEKGVIRKMAQLAEKEALEEFYALRELIDAIGTQLFWDAKLKDIKNTVGGASREISQLGVKMFNVHCDGGTGMMREAVGQAEAMKTASPTGKRPLVLGVTILTSLDYEALVELEIFPVLTHAETDMKKRRIQDRVFHLAMLAKTSGLDGVVCSPQEIAGVRKFCGPGFKIVSPGIRGKDAPPDDQKRTMTPGEAIVNGADALVIGRPITQDKNPVDAAKRIADEIGEARTEKGRTVSW